MLTNMLDEASLKSVAREIDDGNATEPKMPKADRLTKRETALRALRKLRSDLEMHPSAALYRSNPFDGAPEMRVVGVALQQVEIAILTSVHAKEKS